MILIKPRNAKQYALPTCPNGSANIERERRCDTALNSCETPRQRLTGQAVHRSQKGLMSVPKYWRAQRFASVLRTPTPGSSLPVAEAPRSAECFSICPIAYDFLTKHQRAHATTPALAMPSSAPFSQGPDVSAKVLESTEMRRGSAQPVIFPSRCRSTRQCGMLSHTRPSACLTCHSAAGASAGAAHSWTGDVTTNAALHSFAAALMSLPVANITASPASHVALFLACMPHRAMQNSLPHMLKCLPHLLLPCRGVSGPPPQGHAVSCPSRVLMLRKLQFSSVRVAVHHSSSGAICAIHDVCSE
jgi:hypothetical protein